MTNRQPTTNNLEIHESITLDRIIDAIASGDYVGLCTACGSERDGCEPDAEGYMCEQCAEPAVYGAEQLLFIKGTG